MTYEIEIIEPSVQKIIQELANLNLIKLVQKKHPKLVKHTEEPTRQEVLEGWEDNVKEIRAALHEGKSLRSAWSILAELEKEAT